MIKPRHFKKDFGNMAKPTAEIEAFYHLFLDTCDELIYFETKDIADKIFCKTTYKTRSAGKEKGNLFCEELLTYCNKYTDAIIPRNKLPLFS